MTGQIMAWFKDFDHYNPFRIFIHEYLGNYERYCFPGLTVTHYFLYFRHRPVGAG